MSKVARHMADMQMCRGEENPIQFGYSCKIRLIGWLVNNADCLPEAVSVDADMVHKL